MDGKCNMVPSVAHIDEYGAFKFTHDRVFLDAFDAFHKRTNSQYRHGERFTTVQASVWCSIEVYFQSNPACVAVIDIGYRRKACTRFVATQTSAQIFTSDG